jgi:chemotaxis protein methyltransferase WspC
MDTSLDTLKQLLKREIGLDASTIGEATIKKFLGQRMRACKLKNIEDYYDLLENDNNELAALLETAVIPETWFFRDIRPFTFILNSMQANPLKYINNPCNILSIPCSTGEEPYSLAMYLLQAKIPASNFRITAVDISQRALDIANQGYYGHNSFRGRTDKIYLDHYFSYQDDHYIINDSARKCISFHRVNILDARTLPYEKNFDFILCRNLLIYFDVSTKDRAFRNLHRMLKDDGILFIGHSEFGAVPRNLFSNTGSKNAFGLIKFLPPSETAKAAATTYQQPAAETAYPTKCPMTATKAAFSSFIPSVIANVTDKESANKPAPDDKTELLERAQTLADEGKLHEAEALCIQQIDAHGSSCEVFFLLALINEASNKINAAETFYRKAIYLDARHYQSLIHLALLLEKKGDQKAADLLRQRADRAMKK